MHIDYHLDETDADERVGKIVVGVGLAITLLSIILVFLGWVVG